MTLLLRKSLLWGLLGRTWSSSSPIEALVGGECGLIHAQVPDVTKHAQRTATTVVGPHCQVGQRAVECAKSEPEKSKEKKDEYRTGDKMRYAAKLHRHMRSFWLTKATR